MNVGKALWGQKWQRVLQGGEDADKIEVLPGPMQFLCGHSYLERQVLLVLKMSKDIMQDKYRLSGRNDVLILPPTLLNHGNDGNHYYDKSNILKVYLLT